MPNQTSHAFAQYPVPPQPNPSVLQEAVGGLSLGELSSDEQRLMEFKISLAGYSRVVKRNLVDTVAKYMYATMVDKVGRY